MAYLKPSSTLTLLPLLVLTTFGLRPAEDTHRTPYSHHRHPDGHIYGSYSTSNASIKFIRIAIDPSSGRLYVGAVNWLYQLSPELTFEQHVRTGPKKDSTSCSPSDCSGVEPSLIRLTNNYNKALVVDSDSRMLVVCGSVHQGSCRRHRLDDVRNMEPLVAMPVASNDENSSTVAFIGPARYFGNVPTKVLYVAATNSRQGPYRDLIPAISSRHLESSGAHLFSIVEKSFTDIARVDISFHLRDYYLVKYITGFSSNDFVYFATVQRKSHLRALEEWGHVTRLARVCNSDAGFHSYTEITISCQAEGLDYNLLQDAWVMSEPAGGDVLIGVFAAGDDHTNMATGATTRSAMCTFALADIEEKFAENIHLCYNGSVSSRDMEYIAGGVNGCPQLGKGHNVDNFCHEAIKLNGSVPLVAHPLLTYENITLTAVVGTRVGGQAIALLGTSKGSLKRVLINSPHRAEEVDEIMVDAGHPILADLLLDATHEFAYAASAYKIAKIKVERSCPDRSNCSLPSSVAGPQPEPMVHRSPHVTASPTARSSSPSTPRNPEHRSAIPTLPARPLATQPQPRFGEIRPSALSIGSHSSSIEISVQHLPLLPYGDSYLCFFGTASPIQARPSSPRGLICSTPALSERPRIPAGHDHIAVNLTIRSSVSPDVALVQRPFVFFDCGRHKSCVSCVTSSWDCNWCVLESACTGSNASSCSSIAAMVGQDRAGQPPSPSLVRGVDHCPHDGSKQADEILVTETTSAEVAMDSMYWDWIIILISATGALFLIISLIMLVMSRLNGLELFRGQYGAHRARLDPNFRGQRAWLNDGSGEVPVQSGWSYFGSGAGQERATLKPIVNEQAHHNQSGNQQALSLSENWGRYTVIRLQPPLVDVRNDNECQIDYWKTLDRGRIKY